MFQMYLSGAIMGNTEFSKVSDIFHYPPMGINFYIKS